MLVWCPQSPPLAQFSGQQGFASTQKAGRGPLICLYTFSQCSDGLSYITRWISVSSQDHGRCPLPTDVIPPSLNPARFEALWLPVASHCHYNCWDPSQEKAWNALLMMVTHWWIGVLTSSYIYRNYHFSSKCLLHTPFLPGSLASPSCSCSC